MDFENANLESGHNFHRFHEHLNHILKINVIALWVFRQQLAAGLSEAQIKEQIYEDGQGELWGGMPSWKNPDELLGVVKGDLGSNGVVRTFSAFDVFMDSLEAELESWNSYSNTRKKDSIQFVLSKGVSAEDEKEVDKFFRLLDRRSWKLDHEREIKAIYTYYRLSRNCIVHRNGIASSALSDISKSEELKETIGKWATITSDKTAPPHHEFRYGDLINFTHRDALFASSVTRMMALSINKLAIKEIGKEGVVFIAAQKYIFKEGLPIEYLKFENVSKAIAFFMRKRNRVLDANQEEVKMILGQLDILDDCKRKFRRLKERYGIGL